jgi:outer membrane protein assembly factor BamB
MSGVDASTPALLDGVLYSSSNDGNVYGIDASTGNELWHKKVALGGSSDTSSLVATDNTLLVPMIDTTSTGNRGTEGTTHLIALNPSDGTVKWKYSLEKKKRYAMNLMPAIVDDTVLFSDATGGLYRVSIVDGTEIYYVPGVNPRSHSTGGVAVAPEGVVFVTSNTDNKHETEWVGHPQQRGILRAHSLDTGKVLWEKKFDEDASAAPAVGTLGRKQKQGVVVTVGRNPYSIQNAITKIRTNFPNFLGWKPSFVGELHAYDLSGADIWSFKTEDKKSTALEDFAWRDQCWPSHFGSPLISSDGTVVVNWSGGKSFVIRDINHDGEIQPREVSFFEHKSGSNGQTASAPGLLVASTCKKIVGFK